VTFRQTMVRSCLAALIACCLSATMLPGARVAAESGIPAGSGAVITAGAPLAVRTAPGWDAAIAYEIANGSYVTVWGVEQVALDGSLWYPVDGGFVPIDAVSSVATLKGGVTLSQDAVQDAATGEWVEPAPEGAVGADLTATAPENAAAPTDEWVEAPVTDTATDSASDKALTDSAGSVDPAQAESMAAGTVDPASVAAEIDPAGEGVDPLTGQVVAPAAADANSVEPAPSDAAPPSTLGSGGTEPWGEPIATAYITNTGGNGAHCLAAPQWGTETLAVLDEGVPVEVRAETMGEWQPVNCAGAGGYVQAAQIAWSPLEPAESVAALEPGNDGGRRERDAGDGGGAAGGNDIVDFALRYEGHPYVYAGEGPRAFDCSGFTMFVIQRTLGIDITHDMAIQYEMGSQVRRNELQPGDLVFFKNTFRRGLSHTGIYIGDGQFIHAENESTGVRISELDSEYYSSRWYGATRFS
jgi:cell wall-associated NlpC family hydrolase